MSSNQPECNCNVRPGMRHESWCNALKPAEDQNPGVVIKSERDNDDKH
jgi:hypothetical protein